MENKEKVNSELKNLAGKGQKLGEELLGKVSGGTGIEDLTADLVDTAKETMEDYVGDMTSKLVGNLK